MSCKSCEKDVSTSTDNELEIDLCDHCSMLVENMALRPDMWQRLARIVGPNHYAIHDDFYEDDGFPYAPEIEIDEREYHKYPIKRGGPYRDVNDYLYDMLTRYLIIEDEIVLPDQIEPGEIQNALFEEIRKRKNDEEITDKCYQILFALPKSDEIYAFLKERWETDLFECWGAIARCVIKNYPVEESRAVITGPLIEEKWEYPKDALHVLSDYRSRVGIEILEDVIFKREIPIMCDLGIIVRVCNPTWVELKAMIERGRPMSLIAIDALWIEDSPQYERYIQKWTFDEIKVEKSELERTLKMYLEKDSVPRVQSAVKSVFEKYQITRT